MAPTEWVQVQVRFSPEELARVDAARGERSRSQFVKARALGTVDPPKPAPVRREVEPRFKGTR